MTAEILRQLREVAGMGPRDFSAEMGISLAAYTRAEGGETPVRDAHLNAARWALVVIACLDGNTARRLPQEIKEIIKGAAMNI